MQEMSSLSSISRTKVFFCDLIACLEIEEKQSKKKNATTCALQRALARIGSEDVTCILQTQRLWRYFQVLGGNHADAKLADEVFSFIHKKIQFELHDSKLRRAWRIMTPVDFFLSAEWKKNQKHFIHCRHIELLQGLERIVREEKKSAAQVHQTLQIKDVASAWFDRTLVHTGSKIHNDIVAQLQLFIAEFEFHLGYVSITSFARSASSALFDLCREIAVEAVSTSPDWHLTSYDVCCESIDDWVAQNAPSCDCVTVTAPEDICRCLLAEWAGGVAEDMGRLCSLCDWFQFLQPVSGAHLSATARKISAWVDTVFRGPRIVSADVKKWILGVPHLRLRRVAVEQVGEAMKACRMAQKSDVLPFICVDSLSDAIAAFLSECISAAVGKSLEKITSRLKGMKEDIRQAIAAPRPSPESLISRCALDSNVKSDVVSRVSEYCNGILNSPEAQQARGRVQAVLRIPVELLDCKRCDSVSDILDIFEVALTVQQLGWEC